MLDNGHWLGFYNSFSHANIIKTEIMAVIIAYDGPDYGIFTCYYWIMSRMNNKMLDKGR
jgi:hypothetical protein